MTLNRVPGQPVHGSVDHAEDRLTPTSVPGLRIPALRVSRWVDDQLAERGSLGAVVHSVFRRVANLRLDSGDLLSLSSPEVALAPNGITVELPQDTTMWAVGIQPAQPAMLDSMGIRIPGADLVVTFAGAARWEPRPRVRRAAPSELACRLMEARATALAKGAADSLLPLLLAPDGEGDTKPLDPTRAARQPAALLGEAAARYDAGAVRRAARRLAGLGPGLTPSGDDFLAGFAAAWALTAEAIGLPSDRSARVSVALLAGASARASDLGRMWIAHGVRGEVAEPMGRFFTALLTGEPAVLAPAVRGVLALGATSGTDWMAGALLGAEAVLGARKILGKL